MITIDSVSKSFGSRTLFHIEGGITFSSGNRYGLTGPNGSGKSTLLRCMVGLEELTAGTVTLPDRLGYLRQNIEDFLDIRILDVVIMGNQRLWDTFMERDRLYEEEMTDEIGMRLGELEEIIAEEDGYSAESDAEVLLAGMGIAEDQMEEPMRTLPTDMQFRVLLCQALFGDPEALILDEPTNHLDMESITWLESFLMEYRGTLIVVSHDRHFLNSVTTHIADIDYETIIVYPGNYDSMLVSKTSIRQRAEQEAKSKEAKIAKLRDFVSRFGAGSRASQVQSRVREIDRLQPQELKKSNIERPYIRFPSPEKPAGKIVVKAEDLEKAFEGKKVIEGFSLEISREDKIGIIGNNGRGKTTLLKMLAQQLQPDIGEAALGHNVLSGYFPQNHKEIVDKDSSSSLVDWLAAKHSKLYEQEIRSAMGKMLFSGDDAFKQVCHLSGGETARLILADMMLSRYNVLFLDEPNNHLDLESVSALAWGLEEFKGCAIVVSHDRELIGHVANKIIALEEGGITIFDGQLEDYLARKAHA